MMYIMKESCVKFGGMKTTSNWHTLRFRYYPAKSLRMLFKDISPEKIFNFLKEINIFEIVLIWDHF